MRRWYVENITSDQQTLSRDTARVNATVKARAFQIEQIQSLEPGQQFVLAAVLCALKAIDNEIERQIEQLIKEQQVSFQRIDQQLRELEAQTRSGFSLQRYPNVRDPILSDSKEQLSITPVGSRLQGSLPVPQDPPPDVRVVTVVIGVAAGVGAIYLTMKTITWTKEHPQEAKQLVKAAAMIGVVIAGFLSIRYLWKRFS